MWSEYELLTLSLEFTEDLPRRTSRYFHRQIHNKRTICCREEQQQVLPTAEPEVSSSDPFLGRPLFPQINSPTNLIGSVVLVSALHLEVHQEVVHNVVTDSVTVNSRTPDYYKEATLLAEPYPKTQP